MTQGFYPTAGQIKRYQEDLHKNGYLYLEKLPDGFDNLQFAQEFGRVMRQYDGSVIWPVKADPQFDALYHSRNTQKLLPHTECYEFTGLPPKYLVLWCVNPASCGGGKTLLYDSLEYFNSLAHEDYSYLTNTYVTYEASSGIKKSMALSARHLILTPNNKDHDIVRFSRNCMRHDGDEKIEKAAAGLVESFEEDHFEIEWKQNAFLIWDNQRMLHNRTSFTDRTRELHRLWLSDPEQVALAA